MRALGCALLCLVLIPSKFSFGQELALPSDATFKAYLDDRRRIEDEKIEVFIPLTLQPTNNQSGVYQQILNHQLQQMQAHGLPMDRLQQWNGKFNLKRDPANTQTGAMSFQIQPITTQGSVNFQNVGRISVQRQLFLNQTEFRLTPARSSWSFSHVDTSEDSTNRLMYGWEW